MQLNTEKRTNMGKNEVLIVGNTAVPSAETGLSSFSKHGMLINSCLKLAWNGNEPHLFTKRVLMILLWRIHPCNVVLTSQECHKSFSSVTYSNHLVCLNSTPSFLQLKITAIKQNTKGDWLILNSSTHYSHFQIHLQVKLPKKFIVACGDGLFSRCRMKKKKVQQWTTTRARTNWQHQAQKTVTMMGLR